MARIVADMKRSPVLYAMVAPGVLLCAVFSYVPMFGILIAFQDYDLIGGPFSSAWVGLENFRRFFSDPYCWRIIRNTMLLNVYGLVFVFPAPILLALMLNEFTGSAFKRAAQTVSYLPHFMSTVVIVGILQNLLGPKGAVNHLVVALSGKEVMFLMRPEWFRPVYIGSDIWQTIGWSSIIYLAALTGVSPELYESAVIDGAGRWRKMVHISVPSIAPVITTLFILSLSSILSVGFEKVYLLYNPATYETADVIATYLYRKAFESEMPEFGYAAAVGLFQSAVACVFVWAANAAVRRINNQSLW